MSTALASITCGNCGLTHNSVSEVRECYRTRPSARRTVAPLVEEVNRIKVGVPAGRYAIEVDGVVKFFKIDRPDEGRWKGYTFVSEQAGDTDHSVRNPERRRMVTARIAANPSAASKRYGQEIGSCGVCGRTLTDAESRTYGIGPVCRVKTGW